MLVLYDSPEAMACFYAAIKIGQFRFRSIICIRAMISVSCWITAGHARSFVTKISWKKLMPGAKNLNIWKTRLSWERKPNHSKLASMILSTAVPTSFRWPSPLMMMPQSGITRRAVPVCQGSRSPSAWCLYLSWKLCKRRLEHYPEWHSDVSFKVFLRLRFG